MGPSFYVVFFASSLHFYFSWLAPFFSWIVSTSLFEFTHLIFLIVYADVRVSLYAIIFIAIIHFIINMVLMLYSIMNPKLTKPCLVELTYFDRFLSHFMFIWKSLLNSEKIVVPPGACMPCAMQLLCYMTLLYSTNFQVEGNSNKVIWSTLHASNKLWKL